MNHLKKITAIILIFSFSFISLCFAQSSNINKDKLKSPIEIEKKASDALKSGKILLNFENIDITVLTKLISEITGKNIIVDDKIQGKITIVSSSEVSPDQAWKIFKSALQTKGLSVVDYGTFVKIMPEGASKAERTKLATDKETVYSEDMVVAVVILKNADADRLKNSLLPLISASGSISAYDPANSIIITDIPSNVKKLTSIVKNLDVPPQKMEFKIFYLKNVMAESVEASLIKTLGTLSDKGASDTVKISAHKPTNSVLVYGTRYQILQAEKAIKKLDSSKPEMERKFKVYYLENGNAEDISKVLSNMLAERKKVETVEQRGAGAEFASIQVSFDKATNSLVLYATDFEFNVLKDLIAKLDAPRKQILVSAVVAEVSLSKLVDIGVRWQALHQKGTASYMGGLTQESLYSVLASGSFVLGAVGQGTTSVTSSLGTTAVYPNIFFLLSLLETDSDFNVLSAPRLVTLDHLEATMNVGSTQPYASGVKFDSNQNPIVTYDYKDIGLNLKITPHISQSQKIRMDITQKIQEITSYIRPRVGAVDYVVPITSLREYKTTVTVEDNQTVIVGGLVSKRTIDTLNKLPILGDLPFIGKAFQNKKTEDQKITLFAFITPHIIETKEQYAEYSKKYQEFLDKQLKQQEQRVNQPNDLLPREYYALPKDTDPLLQEGIKSTEPKKEDVKK